MLSPVRRTSTRERIDFARLGVNASSQVREFRLGRVLSVQFRAGEWGDRRCGSVVTTVVTGRSRYCTIEKFLAVREKLFARVEWLSPPTYPYAPNRLVVRVRRIAPAQQRRLSCVLSLDDIQPCTVAVLPEADGVHFLMMRDKGTDRLAGDPNRN